MERLLCLCPPPPTHTHRSVRLPQGSDDHLFHVNVASLGFFFHNLPTEQVWKSFIKGLGGNDFVFYNVTVAETKDDWTLGDISSVLPWVTIAWTGMLSEWHMFRFSGPFLKSANSQDFRLVSLNLLQPMTSDGDGWWGCLSALFNPRDKACVFNPRGRAAMRQKGGGGGRPGRFCPGLPDSLPAAPWNNTRLSAASSVHIAAARTLLSAGRQYTPTRMHTHRHTQLLSVWLACLYLSINSSPSHTAHIRGVVRRVWEIDGREISSWPKGTFQSIAWTLFFHFPTFLNLMYSMCVLPALTLSLSIYHAWPSVSILTSVCCARNRWCWILDGAAVLLRHGGNQDQVRSSEVRSPWPHAAGVT